MAVENLVVETDEMKKEEAQRKIERAQTSIDQFVRAMQICAGVRAEQVSPLEEKFWSRYITVSNKDDVASAWKKYLEIYSRDVLETGQRVELKKYENALIILASKENIDSESILTGWTLFKIITGLRSKLPTLSGNLASSSENESVTAIWHALAEKRNLDKDKALFGHNCRTMLEEANNS